MKPSDIEKVLQAVFGREVYHEERDDSFVVGPIEASPEHKEHLYMMAASLEQFFSYLGYTPTYGPDFRIELTRKIK